MSLKTRKMWKMDRLSEFEEKIGYKFRDRNLLFEALTHSSYANESKHQYRSNERLEFLGDSVLSLVVSEYLFETYTAYPEGELSKTRATLVCEKMLAKFAKKIDLGEYIIFGRGEAQNGGKDRPSIVSDAFEAVIAAIYLDGGLEAARSHRKTPRSRWNISLSVNRDRITTNHSPCMSCSTLTS